LAGRSPLVLTLLVQFASLLHKYNAAVFSMYTLCIPPKLW